MDRYARIKKIGEGSFGKALLCRTKENGKQVVVKEINMSRMAKKERDEARKETAVLAQLLHPNIVLYKESFEEIGNLYIVMDYCDGGDLYGRINHQRGILLPEDQILDWFVQTCLAIKHIHDRKILHRDIKSQNIFLTRHGIVKLGDFGIAKVLNSTVELARTCIGTPYYLSPEICENKPYNNKSDIWSLGCVLYELTTLKHAFEAGNMKNLVLKIIRGSYPPPSPRYTYELRSLVNLLFKRSPRDRPSITGVLRKPILQTRIKKFLSESELADEFSHTVMHGVKIKKALPPGGARPLPPKPVAAKKPPVRAPSPRYDPITVYGPSVARKSKDNINQNRKSSDVRKSNGGKRPSSGGAAGNNQDLIKKRQEMVEKEKKRRAEDARKKDANYVKQHQALMDKQKMARINRAREEGWQGLMNSMSSEEGDKKYSGNKRPNTPNQPMPREEPAIRLKPTPVPAKPSVNGGGVASPNFVPLPDRGNYEQYHAYLDQLNEQRKGPDRPVSARDMARPNLGVAGALGYVPADPTPAIPKPSPVPTPEFDPSYFAKKGREAGARAELCAEQARMKEEFMARKKAAALNKARAQGDLFGRGVAATPVRKPSPSPTPKGKPPSGAAMKNEEDDYFSRLRQIRLQNFNDRRALKDKANEKGDAQYKPKQDLSNEQENRKRKIEALRAQADERARKLKSELEKKRKEAYDLEQKRLQMGRDRPDKPKPVAQAKPAPALPMTEAMKAIGAVKDPPIPVLKPMKPPIGMTAAMEAIGAAGDEKEKKDASPLKQKRREILDRLNSKPPVPSKPDRPKWGAAAPVIPAEVPDRPKWGGAGPQGILGNLKLEETASNMEATGVSDGVVKHEEEESSQPSARKHWGGKAGTVLNVLQQADLSETQTGSTTSEGSEPSTPVQTEAASPPKKGDTITIKPAEPGNKEGKAPVVGSTITIGRNPAKGTVVIKKAETISPADTQAPDVSEDKPDESRLTVPDSDSPPSSPEKPSTPARPRSRSNSPKQKQDEKRKLFDKVDLDEEDASHECEDMKIEDVEEESTDSPENREESLKPTPDKTTIKTGEKSLLKNTSGALAIGLTTGHFDADVKLLRTCSEPDLSKLFKSSIAETPFPQKGTLAASADLAELQAALAEHLEDEDEEDEADVDDDSREGEDSKLAEAEPETDEVGEDQGAEGGSTGKSTEETTSGGGTSGGERDGEEEEEEGSDADSDDDLQTMRESMMNILENDDNDSEEEPLSTTAKKKTKKGTKAKKVKTVKKVKKKKKSKEEEGDDAATPGLSKNWSASSVEDFRSMRETMLTLLQPDKEPKMATLKPVPEAGPGGDADRDSVDPPSIITESWQSDDEEDDEYFEEEDMFSRLEESRVKLEDELGCDTFLKAYKAVQAIHEDEDENMDEGSRLVGQILGETKYHLYDTILQLVMADGVFTEDND